MTIKEHEFMILMFARVYELIGILTETLKSRGIWTGDDERAFSHAVHSDMGSLVRFAKHAQRDYLALAKESGLVVGPTS